MAPVQRARFPYMRFFVALQAMFAATFLLGAQISSRSPQLFTRYNTPYDRISLPIAFVLGLILIILSGAFMKKLSAKWIVLTLVLFYALVQVAIQYLTSPQYAPVFLVLMHMTLVLQPIAGFVAIHAILSNWSPPAERTLIVSIVAAAQYFVSFVPWGFYTALDLFDGIVLVVWTVLWIVTIDDAPQQKKRLISAHEKTYIKTSIENYWPRPSQNQGLSIWRILISKEFFSVLFVHITMNWTNVLVNFTNPHPMRLYVLVDIAQICVGVVWGAVMTICLKRKVLSFDITRKISCIIPNLLALVVLIIVFTARSVPNIGILIAVLRVGFAIKSSGAFVNIIDIAPNFAPLLMAIFEIVNLALLPLYPRLVLELPRYEMLVLGGTVIVSVASCILYWFFGSAAQKSDISESQQKGNIHSHKNLGFQPTAPSQV